MDNKTETNEATAATTSESSGQYKEGLLGKFDATPKVSPLDRTDGLLARINNFYEKNRKRR